MLDTDTVIARLDRATECHRLLDHPFYRAWAAGALSLDNLRHYSTQYWRQVESFPDYLQAVAGRVGSPEARGILRKNLRDEIDQDHPGLWLDFADAIGIARPDVIGAAVEPETAGCVGRFEHAASHGAVGYALGMLYGYESQTPAVAETKVTGLKQHYGIDGPGVEYFRLHGVLDVEHSREMATAITLVDEVDVSQAESGARDGASAVWSLLDGVERVRTGN